VSPGALSSMLSFFLVLAGVVGLLFPYAAAHANPPEPMWLVAVLCIPPSTLILLGLFGPRSFKVAVLKFLGRQG
jgi:hypothetical protein